MSTQPTDAEIDELWRFEASKNWDSTLAMRTSYTRAVLARWGQPAHSGEPVAWKHDCAALLTNDVELWIDACPHCGKPRNAPQPAEREPLTDELIDAMEQLMAWQVKNVDRWHNRAYDHAHDVLTKFKTAHGIKKGGQHGAE